MARNSKLQLRVVGKRDGEQANPDLDTFVIEGQAHPDIFAAMRAYFDANPGVRKVEITLEGEG